MAAILIVDDEPLNRELLRAFLGASGHELFEAESGARAIEIAGTTPIDLVLLDVMMPGLDGFETTRRLKELSRDDGYLPVVLVTALSDKASLTQGLRAGADEFLTKPVDRIELSLRVQNLLSLRATTEAVRAGHATLLRRATELSELHRFKDEMAALLVHDLKGPLAAIGGNLEFVSSIVPAEQTDVAEALQDAQSATGRLTRLVNNLLDLARLEAGRLEPKRSFVEVQDIVAPLIQQRTVLARSREIALATHVAPGRLLHVDSDLLSRVVENILDNAMRYTPRGGRIEISTRDEQGAVGIDVGNTGPPIPAEWRRLVFEKYAQAGAGHGRSNLGLGLYFCRLAVETHGGSLRIEERPHLPTVFALDLPAPVDPLPH